MAEKMHATIDELIAKYENNTYILDKLNNYITKTLPTLLESADTTHTTREKRKQDLIIGTD